MKNIQHSTFNVQYRTKARTHHHWMLVVKCWVLNVPKFILIFGIRVYRWTVSPVLTFLFGPAGGCRFTPSCSQYAMDAIDSQGVLAGGWLAARRICRCHPWGDCGHDPAPKKEFGIRPSALRFDAADVEACRAGATGEGGNSEFGI
jgi:putative membrane protein insertion efficiency factor